MRVLGIEPRTSVLSGQRSTTELYTHMQTIYLFLFLMNDAFIWIYQDSVLPLYYTRMCKQFIYFYFWRTTHLYGYIRTAFYHSTIHACVNNLFIFIWDNNLYRSVKLWATRRIVPQKRLTRATAKSLWAKFLTRPLILSIRAGKKFCVLFCGSYSLCGGFHKRISNYNFFK